MNVGGVLKTIEMYYDEKVNVLKLEFEDIYIEIHNNNTHNQITKIKNKLTIIGDYDYVIKTIKSVN